MKSTIRRLLFAVVAIAMTMPSFAFKLNDVFSVKGEDGNTLLYQITNANLSNLEVSVNAPRDKNGNNLTPGNPVVVLPAEVTDAFNYHFKVTSIGRFGGTNITSITVPEGVKKLDEGCFYYRDNLKTIAFLGDTPIEEENIGTDAFTPQTGDKTILDNCENFFVRKDNINAYKSHRYWETWADKMKTSFENGTEEYFPMSDKAVSLLKTTSTN